MLRKVLQFTMLMVGGGLLVILSGCASITQTYQEGWYLQLNHPPYQTHLLVDKNEEIWVLLDTSSHQTLFETLQTGDEIAVQYSVALETYPAQLQISRLQLQEKEAVKEIPLSIKTKLEQLGWSLF